ncbi:MAG: hypothetical protein Q7S52_05415 [bacterium]|nr:hypothetical protein [bacterium]
MAKIYKENLHEWWAKGNTIRHGGKLYKVHKMSYGDYFLEPTTWAGGELDGFAPNTKWFYKKENSQEYGVRDY